MAHKFFAITTDLWVWSSNCACVRQARKKREKRMRQNAVVKKRRIKNIMLQQTAEVSSMSLQEEYIKC